MFLAQLSQDLVGPFDTTISTPDFVIDILIAAALSYLLGLVYERFGRSLSNRGTLARNFVVIGMTTMLIITIVKSSLALSLGLVGALSIVRFRTAIKEPEELAYLFLAIAVGLGMGAHQRLVTLIGFAIIVGLILIRNVARRGEEGNNLYVTVRSDSPGEIDLQRITETLSEHCSGLRLRRFDGTKDYVEASYVAAFDGFRQLQAASKALEGHGDAVTTTFVDQEGLG